MMQMEKSRFRLRILLPSILVFMVGLILSVGGSYYLQNDHLKDDVIMLVENVDRVYRGSIDHDARMMESALLYIKDDKAIQEAWTARDRERLYALTEKNFLWLKHYQRVTHLYFIDLNKRVFLRVHNPDKYGDVLTRQTMEEAARTGSPTVGVEFGIHHNLTLRNVQPWYIKGRHVGFVEMGEEIDHIMPHVSEILDAEVFATFKKANLSREEWEKGISLYGHDTRWNILDQSVVIGKTMEDVPQELDQYLNRQDETTGELFSIKDGDAEYFGSFLDLKDIRGDKVGKLVVLKEVTDRRIAVRKFIIVMIALGIILFIIIMFLVVTYINVISEKLEYYHKKLENAAYIDPLTQIGNRRHLFERTGMVLGDGHGGCAMLLDVDNFKQVNDRYGHNVGDEVLRMIGSKLQSTIRKGDIFARYGGEEFVLIMPGCPLEIALQKAETIRDLIASTPVEHGDETLIVTVSVGVTKILANDTFEGLMARADGALYEAKGQGKNRVEVEAS